MSERQETVADVLAKMRYGTIPKHRTDHELLALYADRIEAAWKREECSRRGAEVQSGNAAALRDALEQLSDKVCDYLQNGLIQLPLPIEGLLKQARAALSAPPRNCDMYDKEEVRMAYHLHGDGLMTMQAVVDWLFSPRKEASRES